MRLTFVFEFLRHFPPEKPTRDVLFPTRAHISVFDLLGDRFFFIFDLFTTRVNLAHAPACFFVVYVPCGMFRILIAIE